MTRLPLTDKEVLHAAIAAAAALHNRVPGEAYVVIHVYAKDGTELGASSCLAADKEPDSELERDPELDMIEFRPTQRCPICWTYGHDHRKTCPHAGTGMANHVRMGG